MRGGEVTEVEGLDGQGRGLVEHLELEPGDEVVATNPESGETSKETVAAVWIHSDTLMELELDDGSTVTTTTDHPFWNHTDQQWQPADQLDPGDQLLTPDGITVTVNGLLTTTTHTDTAYTIHEVHTYYVLAGNTPVLVHNTCDVPSLGRAVRPVGSALESVEDVMANPSLLRGMTPAQVEAIIGRTPG